MFSFNGIEKDYITSIEEIDTHYGPDRTVERNEISGRDGAVLRRTNNAEKKWTVKFVVKRTETMSLQEIADDMVGWLYTETPKRIVFPNEPDKYYNVMVEGGIDKDEIVTFARCTVTFISLDGKGHSTYLYTNTAISDTVDVVNGGTDNTDFMVEATALKNSTMFMITKGDEDYFMVGEPEDATEETKDLAPYQYRDEFNKNSLLGWTNVASGTDYGDGLDGGEVIGGRYTVAPNSLYVENWGDTGQRAFHGASIMKSLGKSLQDFRFFFKISVRQSSATHPGKSVSYLYDEQGRVVFSVGYIDTAVGGNTGSVVVNAYNEYGESTRIYTRRTSRPDMKVGHLVVYMYLERKGTQLKVETFKYDDDNDPLRRKVRDLNVRTYNDTGGHFSSPVRLTHIFQGKAKRINNVQRHFILGIHIQELIRDNKAIPILIRKGDEIFIDGKASYVSINDKPVIEHKDFGSNYFKIDKGLNTLLIEPQGTFDTKVKWYDRFL